MSRIRSIHPGIASDEAYMSMSMAAKAAWPILWTECDDHGVFEWKPIVLKARIFPADTIDFTALLAEYEGLGCVQKAEIGGRPVGLIRNFCRYQRPKSPSYRFEISPAMAEYVGVKLEKSDSPPPALPQGSPSPTEKSPQMKEEGDSREEEEKEIRRKAPRRISYPPRFEALWAGYPSDPGMSKAEALPEWQKLTPDEQEACIASMPAFKTWIAKQGPEYRVIHACRYLKKRRWEGFGAAIDRQAAVDSAASSRVYVKYGTDAGDAWEAHHRAMGKIPPRDQHGGWWFDSETPPENVQR